MVELYHGDAAQNPLTKTQILELGQQGFSGSAKRLRADDNYKGYHDPLFKNKDMERILEIVREIRNAQARSDLPALDLMVAESAQPKVYAPQDTMDKVQPAIRPGTASIPVVISSHLLSAKSGLTPEEVAALAADAVAQRYNILKPLTVGENAALGAVFGATAGGAAGGLANVAPDAINTERRMLLAAAGGAVLGAATEAVSSVAQTRKRTANSMNSPSWQSMKAI